MAEEEGEGSGGGGKLKLILIVLLLVIAGIAAFFFLTQEEEDKPEIIREGPPPLEKPEYLDLGTFIINLKDGKYYLKTSIQLAFADVMAKTWLEARLPIVKDLIITQLQSLTSRQIRVPRVRMLLKRDLLIKLNSLFPNLPMWEDRDPIKKILFVEFYRQ